MNKTNLFHTYFKNESSSDSEEEEVLSNIKKIKTNNELIEENNESSHQLFASNAFKPSKSLQIRDNCETKAQKRFSIWSDILMEEELNHNINNSMNIKNNKFKSKSNKMDRNCENYSFWTKKELENNKTSNQLNEELPEIVNNCNIETKSRKRKKKRNRKEKRDIPLEIAIKLNEPKLELMRRIVQTIGDNKALELCSSALNIESAGGLMTSDGSRRRSPGGVFFQLLKNDPKITKESVDYIFLTEQQVFKRKKRTNKRAKRKLLNNLNKSLSHSLTVNEDELKSRSIETIIPVEENEEKSPLNIPLEIMNSCNN